MNLWKKTVYLQPHCCFISNQIGEGSYLDFCFNTRSFFVSRYSSGSQLKCWKKRRLTYLTKFSFINLKYKIMKKSMYKTFLNFKTCRNQPKSRILIHKKSPNQDFIIGTLAEVWLPAHFEWSNVHRYHGRPLVL